MLRGGGGSFLVLSSYQYKRYIQTQSLRRDNLGREEASDKHTIAEETLKKPKV